MATKFLLHDVRAFKAAPIKMGSPALQHFHYVIRGLGPFTRRPDGIGLMYCETLDGAKQKMKQLHAFDLLTTNEQIQALVTGQHKEAFTGGLKRMLMCASWMYGFKYDPATGALFKDVPKAEFTQSNQITLTQLNQAKPVRKYVDGNWEDIVYKDIEPVSSSLDDTFGIGQPRTKSTKPWTPDEPRDDIDIMDSIRKACNGR